MFARMQTDVDLNEEAELRRLEGGTACASPQLAADADPRLSAVDPAVAHGLRHMPGEMLDWLWEQSQFRAALNSEDPVQAVDSFMDEQLALTDDKVISEVWHSESFRRGFVQRSPPPPHATRRSRPPAAKEGASLDPKERLVYEVVLCSTACQGDLESCGRRICSRVRLIETNLLSNLLSRLLPPSLLRPGSRLMRHYGVFSDRHSRVRGSRKASAAHTAVDSYGGRSRPARICGR